MIVTIASDNFSARQSDRDSQGDGRERVAVAATFVIITGGIDLSVSTLMTFCAVIAGSSSPIGGCRCRSASLDRRQGVVRLGLGVLIAKMKIPPFIATLGMMMLPRACPW